MISRFSFICLHSKMNIFYKSNIPNYKVILKDRQHMACKIILGFVVNVIFYLRYNILHYY